MTTTEVSAIMAPPVRADEHQPVRFRAHARRAVHLRATLRLEGSAWQSDATVLNLGIGGACLALARMPQAGDAVSVALATPGLLEPLVLTATVRWVRGATTAEPPRAGLAFDHEGPGELAALADVLDALL